MNKEKIALQVKEIDGIFANARSVKGDNFVQMVKFVCALQSFGMMMLQEIRHQGASDERMDEMSQRCALFSASLCSAHAKVLDISVEDFEEAVELAEKIDNRIQTAVKN